MKFGFTSLSVLALGCSMFGSALAGSRLREKCGSGAVTNSTTVQHNGHEIELGSITCPDLQRQKTARSLEERQTTVSICSNGGCIIDCVDTGAQPFVGDCQEVADYLESLYPQEFIVDPGAFAYVSYASCAFGFLNDDVVNYAVCYETFGYDSILVADQCFADWPATTATAGGLCLTSTAEGNAWDLEVYNPN
ncbi:hypothetical protein EWM64_g9640 [Hericium alpestre]|uniref:Uncharacterized protein n=1 Tax=Hericium alpestre TaxID=135208 RepID=A0A4Y9ZI96_9AGAM|nr:hypothetical protein EWM64_g9640 [Hericium alpestre]